MKPKSIIKEIVLLLSIFLFMWLIVFCSTGEIRLNGKFAIDLHDTSFVIVWSKLILVPYLLILAILYFIRESFFKYRRSLQNTILLLIVALINIMLLKLVAITYAIAPQTKGWTIYPPLSTLPTKYSPPSPLIIFVLQILFYTQIFFIIILVIVAILTGKTWKPKQ